MDRSEGKRNVGRTLQSDCFSKRGVGLESPTYVRLSPIRWQRPMTIPGSGVNGSIGRKAERRSDSPVRLFFKKRRRTRESDLRSTQPHTLATPDDYPWLWREWIDRKESGT